MVISTDPAGESYTAHGGYTVFPPLSVCLRYASPGLDLPPTLITMALRLPRFAGCFVSIRLLTLTRTSGMHPMLASCAILLLVPRVSPLCLPG